MTLSAEEQDVLDHLREFNVGRINGIGGKALADELNMPNRIVRKAIESLVSEHGIPIGSDPIRGYYLIACEEEYKIARYELVSRLRALGKRLRALDAAFLRWIADHQNRLPFEPEEYKPCS